MPTALSLSLSKLYQVYKRYVKYDETEMDKNKRIAEEVVDGFKRYLKDEEGISVEILVQGSAFEGIKVGRPDEFDFILTLDSGGVTPTEARNVPGRGFSRDQRQSLAGYWQLGVSDFPPEGLAKFCSDNAISARQCKAQFQMYINKYTQEVRSGRYVQGIRYYDQRNASIGNPALTLVVSKAGGREISIDMSICIKVRTGWIWRTECYYIAKQHSSEKSDKFWLVMNSHQELEMFQSMPTDVKVYYRTIKFLLQQKVQNSYILKTAFLHLYNKHSNRQQLSYAPTLLRLMNEFLRDHYRSGQLPTFFNQSENLLERYYAEDLENNAGYFSRLCNKKFDEVVDELIERAVPVYSEQQSLMEDAAEADQSGWRCVII